MSGLPVARRLMRAAPLPVATLAVLLFMVVPVPALLLDIGFVGNIALSLAVLMVALNVRRVLDFSSFPTVLLFATLLRLALNVASARVVLVHGHEGEDAAGQVIAAFAHALIGGDWVVGLLVFAILMVINLVVITKGAGRVSEVSARFTLDALPGKQMAIDADLNAGLLTPEEAKDRRAEVATEADFYGSMDGASKFVKGDAIAGVLILFINIIGGVLIGVIGRGMSLGDAVSSFISLAIGDALVAQVPALLLSIAAAAVVTRVQSAQDLSGQIGQQFAHPMQWATVGAIMATLAIMPAMPHLMLGIAATICGAIALQLRRADNDVPTTEQLQPIASDPTWISWDDVGDRAIVSLDIGVGLVPLVETGPAAPLMARLSGLRRQLSQELGFVLPMVRVRDDLNIPPNQYRLLIGGVAMAEGEIWPLDLMALNAGDVDMLIDGRPGRDPTFGLPATWIRPDQRVDAIAAGYAVVDAPTVVATHIGQLLRRHADQLFGIDDARAWIDQLRDRAPQLAETLAAPHWPLPIITQLLASLLGDGVTIAPVSRIAAALAIIEPGQGIAATLSALRVQLAPLIAQSISPAPLPLPVATLDAALEALLGDSVRIAQGRDLPIDPQLAARLQVSTADMADQARAEWGRIALVTSPDVRPHLARLLRRAVPDVAVLSVFEVPDDRQVTIISTIGAPDTPTHMLLPGEAA